ncbi:pyruvate kinase, partial [Rhizobium ruizarguesonis]
AWCSFSIIDSSKIEKPQDLERIEEIIELSDELMVARGDLGVEMPLESVPGIQKQLIRACRRSGKPVVVATQMLESMISAPVPTR